MHGARGVLESVVQAYPETDVDIHVVWVPMLGSDNESAAREISGMFDDPRVHQYWDPERRSGTSYSAHVFPTYLMDIQNGLDATLAADHWWHEMKRDWKAAKPENAPLWDVAFLYDAGTKWGEHPPAPRDTVKQVFFYGLQSGGKSGMFFAGFKNPPLDTDWAVELAKAMTKLTGRKPKTPPKKDTALSRAPSDAAGCEGGAIRAKLLVLKVSGLADGSTTDDVVRALDAIKGVIRATADADSNLIQLLVDADRSVTAERAVEFLGLAGYEAKEASQENSQSLLQMHSRASRLTDIFNQRQFVHFTRQLVIHSGTTLSLCPERLIRLLQLFICLLQLKMIARQLSIRNHHALIQLLLILLESALGSFE
ncbi:MAG: hypothetical protein IH987_05020 [Planctomycetes bacterium]|nr:hypothetical protein [Planctomycetota bacterium]